MNQAGLGAADPMTWTVIVWLIGTAGVLCCGLVDHYLRRPARPVLCLVPAAGDERDAAPRRLYVVR